MSNNDLEYFVVSNSFEILLYPCCNCLQWNSSSRTFSYLTISPWVLTQRKLTVCARAGSTANGTLDGFFGATKPRTPYNATAVLFSPAGRALAKLSDSLPFATAGFGPMSDVRELLAMRYESTVRCNPSAAGPRTQSPCPAGEACLFDLVADPCETNNVAKKYVAVSGQLYEALKYYRRLLVPQTNRPFDPAANPARFNNTWSSWMYWPTDPSCTGLWIWCTNGSPKTDSCVYPLKYAFLKISIES